MIEFSVVYLGFFSLPFPPSDCLISFACFPPPTPHPPITLIWRICAGVGTQDLTHTSKSSTLSYGPSSTWILHGTGKLGRPVTPDSLAVEAGGSKAKWVLATVSCLKMKPMETAWLLWYPRGITRVDASDAGEGYLLSMYPFQCRSQLRPDPSPGCWSGFAPLLEFLNNSQNAEGRIGPGLPGLAYTPLSDRLWQDFSCEFRASLGFKVRTLMSQNNGRWSGYVAQFGRVLAYHTGSSSFVTSWGPA